MKNKICIYTCITGDYDNVNELPFKEKGVDYFLFTNNKKITSNTWNVIYINNIADLDKIKVLGHDKLKKYDITVWVDGASYIKKSVCEFIDKYCDFKKYDLIGFKHRERDCIYDEALECAKVLKDKKDVLKKQITLYEKNGYPKHNGLIESTILFRKNKSNNLAKTMIMWFDEIKKHSCRDQISFNYVAYKTGLKFNLLDFNVFNNDYFGWNKHVIKKEIKNFSVYFGDDISFDFDSVISDDYKINGNLYIGKFKVKKNCNLFKIQLCSFPGLIFDNLHIDCGYDSYNLVNWSQYYDIKLFDGGVPTIFLYGNFKKNQVVKFSIEMSVISEDFYLELIKKLNYDVIVLNRKRRFNFFKKRGVK